MDVLRAQPWQGNVRQLRATVERLTLLAQGRPIDARLVRKVLGMASADAQDARATRRGNRAQLVALLSQHGENVTQAARAVGLPRTTFRRWLDEVGVPVPRSVGRPRTHQPRNGPRTILDRPK